MHKETVTLNEEKIEEEKRFDGEVGAQDKHDPHCRQVALKYKELWQVEQVFRDMKSILDTRPIFHQRDETIRGHVFSSFLALVLRKELDRRLLNAGHDFEWTDIKQDLNALQEITIEDRGQETRAQDRMQGHLRQGVPGRGGRDPSHHPGDLMTHTPKTNMWWQELFKGSMCPNS